MYVCLFRCPVHGTWKSFERDVCVCVCVCVSVCPSVRLSVCPSVRLFCLRFAACVLRVRLSCVRLPCRCRACAGPLFCLGFAPSSLPSWRAVFSVPASRHSVQTDCLHVPILHISINMNPCLRPSSPSGLAMWSGGPQQVAGRHSCALRGRWHVNHGVLVYTS